MNRFIATEVQPDFPNEDLSDSNALLLELMLSNYELFRRGHSDAEAISRLFKMNHPAIMRGAQRIYDDDVLEAVSHGVEVLESASAYVLSTPMVDLSRRGCDAVGWITGGLDEDYLRKYIGESVDALTAEMPRLAEVSRATSRRLYGHLTEYALVGTALARRLAVDAAA